MLVADSMPPNSDSLPLIGKNKTLLVELKKLNFLFSSLQGVYYLSAIIIVSIATAMSVASLNLYHRGKHHVQPVPKWISRLFFCLLPKLLLMNISLPNRLKKRERISSDIMTRIVSSPLIRSKSIEVNRIQYSIDYIHRLIEHNQRRSEEQDANLLIIQEWQILGRVVDRLFVWIFLIGTMFVFYLIFSQAPRLRLK